MYIDNSNIAHIHIKTHTCMCVYVMSIIRGVLNLIKLLTLTFKEQFPQ